MLTAGRRGVRLFLALLVFSAVVLMHTGLSKLDEPAPAHVVDMVMTAPVIDHGPAPQHPANPGSPPHDEHVGSMCQSAMPTSSGWAITLLLLGVLPIPRTERARLSGPIARHRWRAREPPDLARLCVLRV